MGQEVMLPPVTPPQGISFSHLLRPLELRAYGNWELGPSCSSHVGTIPIYHFEKWMVFQPLAHGF